MASGLVSAEASRLLNASLGFATYTAPTAPLKMALNTTAGTASVAGTEPVGGSYARQTFTPADAGGTASTSNTNTMTFTNMPAGTDTAVELYDSSGTPRRAWFGTLTSSRTVGAGDTISFAPGSVTPNFTTIP